MKRLLAALALSLAALPAAAQTIDQLVGRWGFVSYWNESDKTRSIAQARGECGQPYIIAKGAKGGVMLHGADNAEPTEMTFKVIEGKTYLVPVVDENMPNSVYRALEEIGPNMFITRYMDDFSHQRYGNKLYVRCGAAPASIKAQPAAANNAAPTPAEPSRSEAAPQPVGNAEPATSGTDSGAEPAPAGEEKPE